MKSKKIYTGDKDVQLVLGTLLRVGVMASMAVVCIGGIIYLFSHHASDIDYADFDPEKSRLSSIGAIISGIAAADGAAVIQFGVLLLIFTPVLRVVFSVFSFLIERDYLYVFIGLFVLAIILFSLSNKLAG